jgi:PPE-repeat protein
MVSRIFYCAALLAATFFIAENASAQGRSMSGMSGLGGMSSSGFGNSGFGSSSLGRSGFGSSGFGSSGFGNSGFGSSGFGSSGFGNSGMGRSGFGNSGFGNSGFGGGQYGGGTNFVGRDATDMQGTFGQASRAQTQFFNNMNRQMSRNNRNRNAKKTTSNASQQLRLDLKVGFNVPSASSNPALAEQIRTRITAIAAQRKMSQPLLTIQGDTAVITGTAASDSERIVIGQLVAMEPGVRDVQNLMSVAGEPTDIAQPPGG